MPLLLPGSLNDGGWNAAAYAGLMELKDEGYEVAFTENIAIAGIEEAMRNYALEGFDLVIGHGFEFGEPAMRVAAEYPDVNFYVSGKMPDGVSEEDLPANTGFMDMKEYEAALSGGHCGRRHDGEQYHRLCGRPGDSLPAVQPGRLCPGRGFL